MIGTGGELYDVPAAEIAEMSRRGYRLESESEAKKRQLQEEYGGTGSEIATFAHGVGKALSFGALDVAGKAIGGDAYAETVKKLKEANPDASLAGEIAGITGALFMPGGQSKAMQGLSKLAAPVKSVAKLGRAVERGTLKALGGPKGGLIRQSLARGGSLGTGAGVEGALYGAGEFISEAALGEIEPTAENFLAHAKTGLMWGGAAGGALGAAGPLIGKVLGSGKAFAKNSGRSIRRLWERATGRKAVDGLDEALEQAIIKPLEPSLANKAYGAFYDFDPKKMERLSDPKNLERARKGAELREAATGKLGGYMDEMNKLSDEITEEGIGKAKYRGIREVQEQADVVSATQEATGMLQSAHSRLDEMLAAGTAEYANPAAIKQARDAIKSANKVLTTDMHKLAAGVGAEDMIAKAYIKLDQTKRTLQKRIKRLWRRIDKDDPQWTTIDELTKIETAIRENLENPKLWGAGITTRQIKSNRGWVQKLKKKHMISKFSELYEEVAYKPIFKTNRKTLKNAIDHSGLETNKFPEEYLDNFVDDQLAPARAIAEAFELGPKYQAKIKQMDELAGKFKKEWDTIKETVGLENQLAEITQKSNAMGSLMPGLGAAGVGYMVGGEEGAAIGLALSPFTNPGRKLQLQAAIARISGDMGQNINKAIKGYINKASGKVKLAAAKGKRIVGPTAQKVLQESNWGDKRTKDKSRLEAFHRRAKELNDFVGNPQLAADRLTKNTEAVSDVAPKLATAIQVKALNAATFLHNKMPKATRGTSLLEPKFQPSEVDLIRWERYVEAVADPTVLLRDLAKGMLTRETVEAVERVYPKMYEQIVLSIAEQIPALRDELPYKEKINLSTLFQLPVDRTMEPRFYQTMQMIAAAPPPEAAQQSKSAAGAVWGKMKAGQVALTETQRVQAENA